MTDTRAPDGSPVDLYRRLPTFGEPELVHAAIPAAAEILELGAGAGRMTRRLRAFGHPVTAVDSSREMLAHVEDATTVLSSIEALDLGKQFPCVLLASHLVNVADDRQRAAFLAACARHVTAEGTVLIERYDPEWAADPKPSTTVRDGVRMSVMAPRREGPMLTAAVEYELDGQTWLHGPFTSRILDDAEIEARLYIAGLLPTRWLDERRSWLAARPAGDVSALYVAIPAAEPLVAEHRMRWDPAGPVIPAHVTVLFPFLDPALIRDEVLDALRAIAAGVRPFDVEFRRVGRFPDVVWLAPEPSVPFGALTDSIAARWPDHPPYGGAFEDVVHHLTVADGAPADVLVDLETTLAGQLPIRQRVEAVTLAARRSGDWVEEAVFPLVAG